MYVMVVLEKKGLGLLFFYLRHNNIEDRVECLPDRPSRIIHYTVLTL